MVELDASLGSTADRNGGAVQLPQLVQQTAVITGSSRGVGAATALIYAARRWNIVLNCSRSVDAAEQVAEQCRSAGARDVLIVPCDISEEAGCHKLIDAAVARFGVIDVLINNAGTTKFTSHHNLGGLDVQDFHRIYQLNTVAPFLLARRAAPHMRVSGAIVNVSSVAGLHGIGSSIAYAASKGALNAITKSLARVLGESKRVRVNAVCPGFIRGDWLEQGLGSSVYEHAKASYERGTVLHSTLSPADVAGSLVALADAPMVTGQLLAVDAGMGLSVVALPPGVETRSHL